MSRGLVRNPILGERPRTLIRILHMSLADIRLREPAAADAIATTLPLEGDLVNNKADPGGVTNKGVSLRFALAEIGAHPDELKLLDLDHDGDVDWHDIVAMTADTAADVYYRCIWQRYGYGRLVPALVAWKTFDICVNTGPKRAAMILQQALCDLGHVVPCDGSLGPKTVAAVEAVSNLPLLSAMRVRQAAFYRRLVEINPKLSTFAAGWQQRAAA